MFVKAQVISWIVHVTCGVLKIHKNGIYYMYMQDI